MYPCQRHTQRPGISGTVTRTRPVAPFPYVTMTIANTETDFQRETVSDGLGIINCSSFNLDSIP